MDESFIGTVIELSERERLICEILATNQIETAQSVGAADRDLGAMSLEENHFLGAVGELVACKIFGVYPTQLFTDGCRSTKMGTDPGDLLIGRLWIDFKATDCDRGRLIVPADKIASHVDAYGLITGKFPRYTFRGFMERSELMRPGRLCRMRNLCYVATQSELKELQDLECWLPF